MSAFRISVVAFAFATLACVCSPGARAGAADAPDVPSPSPAPVPAPKHYVTHHAIRVGGADLAYTATAGTILLVDAKDEPEASVFYTAYVRNGDAAKRPLTFFYNGGPGSSSGWLHMLSFGPRRVEVRNPGLTPAAPYALVDNQQTLLDRSDLVFVDAVGTGFSRIVGKGKPETFYGIDQDAKAFAQFIRRYVTANDRWNSPKFLFGESYGTTRSAVLVDRLQNDGMDFRGVVLLSSILNFSLDSTLPTDDAAYPLYLPTQAAVAAYHHALPNQPTDLPAFLAEVRAFAAGPYASALALGDRIPPATRDAIVARLHAYTGLSPNYLALSNLRVTNDRFEKELFRDRGRTLGRLDGRFLGIDIDPVADSPEYDPTDPAITGPVTATLNRYVRDELGYRTNDEYRTTNYPEVGDHWDFRRSPGAEPNNFPAANVAGDLKDAMTKNALLHVFSANGYYDFATPFFATEYTLDHLALDPSLRRNVSYGYYESGHMVYLDPSARARLRADLDRFYEAALR